MEKRNFKELIWKQESRNLVAPLTFEFFFRGMKDSYLRKFGFDYKGYKKVRDKGYIEIDNSRKFIGTLREKARQDKNFMHNLFRIMHEDCEAFVKKGKILSSVNYANTTDYGLKSYFLDFCGASFNASHTLTTTLGLGVMFEDIILKELEKRFEDRQEIEEQISILTSPEKETRTSKSHQELLEIAVKIKNGEKEYLIEEFVREHHFKYSWLNVRFGYGLPFTYEETLKRASELAKNTPEKKIEIIKEIKARITEKTEEITRKLNFDRNFREIIHFAKENSYFRTYRLESYCLAGFYAIPMFNEIAKRLGVSYDELFYMTIEEISTCLDYRMNMAERRKEFGAVYYDGDITYYTKNDLILIEEHEEKETAKKIFQGIIANKGFAKGKAKIIKGKNDLGKVEKGDILVAEFTTPDFVPAMEKASAIIADIGGLTSHTAVVARELGKPCIVATIDASRHLKDNDIVIVDADKGIVRKSLGLTKISTGDHKVTLFMYLFMNGFNVEQEKVIGLGHKNQIIVFNENRTRFYLDPKEIEDLGNILLEKLKHNPQFGFKLVKDHIKTGEKFLSMCENISGIMLNKKSSAELAAIMSQYFDVFSEFSAYHALPVTLEREISATVTEYLKTKTGDLNETLIDLTTPDRESSISKEKYGLLQIVLKIKKEKLKINSEKIKKLLKEHTNNYSWMGTSQKYSPYSIEHFENELKNLLTKDIETEIKRIEKRPVELKNKRKEILAKLRIDKQMMVLIDLLRELSYMREFKRDTGYKTHYYMEKLWQEIGGRANLTAEYVKNCTPKELKEFLTRKMPLDKKIIEERIRYSILAMIDGKISLLTGKDAKELEELEAKEEQVEKVSSVKGMPACKGYAKGKAKIILLPKDISKVEKGDILVAVNTEPAMVPAMEKASAIVTEEGGLTCHAAIVSRELGIPCVIGTKIATKVFKDGDIIEVDANKGIVRKI